MLLFNWPPGEDSLEQSLHNAKTHLYTHQKVSFLQVKHIFVFLALILLLIFYLLYGWASLVLVHTY